MDDIQYTEEAEVLQELTNEAFTKLYTLQFLSHKCDPVQFFTENKLEDKIVQLDDVGKGYEEMIIRIGWKAILDEGKKKQSKYARVARVFLPTLRKIYYKGHLKQEAQYLIEEMCLQSTVPFNDLGNDFGGDNYSELDSYTGQPLDHITPEQERMDLGDKAAPVIPQLGDGLVSRIASAYTNDKVVVSEHDLLSIQATNASRESYDVSEEVWYEERKERPSPIQQENEQMLHLDMREVYRLIHSFRSMWERKTHLGRVIFWWLKEHAYKCYEPQNLLAVCHAFCISENMLKKIHCPLPGVKNLYEMDRHFGNDIIDEFNDLYDVVIDNEGFAKNTLTEDDIFEIGRHFEKEIINTFDGQDIKHTKVYARGVFNALATSEADLTGAGYKNWRWNKSKQGSQAFDFAYCQAKFEGANDRNAYKLAWHKFWDAGFIVKVHPDGLTVASEGNGKSRKVSWQRASDEIATELIRLTKKEKERLVKLLTENDWGAELVYSLGA